ncbi:choice-of-anchor D domain-containing protein [Actinokineospora xionganensis]|uniref:Choice-of-anchor D domain-containing protein n=1 Tax=Actinokineospora xionganensis TaxID=2684470 RepID=A0ABR7LDZ9_9PSEU|nr:choice-of-anchor D domain-containing protein [Actinokineospora xionganensis]MBC6450872.1 choice-of-anchor D domain-containing protein [Actinokineospora xionganensis]
MAPAAAAGGPPAAPHTALTVHFEGWGYIDGNFSYEPSRNTVNVLQQTANGYAFQMQASRDSHTNWHSIDLSPAKGIRFTAGESYSTVTHWEPQDSVTVLNIRGDGQSCSGTGTLKVLEAVYDDATGNFTAFAATYSAKCSGVNQVATGEIRFQSSLDYRAADSWDPYRVRFGSQAVGLTGSPLKVTVEANGTLPTTFGAASLSGSSPGSFAIASNTCSGNVLSYGQKCELTFTATAPAVGDHNALLTLVEDSVGGKITRLLDVTGYVDDRGTYYPLSPHRVLDTRNGTNAPVARVAGGQELRLQLPSHVAAAGSTVVINVTVADALASGHISIYPTGVPRPTVSSLNYKHGWTGANSVTVKLGADGAINLYNSGGSVHLIADLNGYYAKDRTCCNSYTGGQYHPLANPGRLVDTREWGVGRVPADYYIKAIASWGATINPKIRAFAVNITATDPVTSGYLSAWSGYNGTAPSTSTLNYTRGATVSNFAVVPTMPCEDCGSLTGAPSIAVYTNNDSHIIVDIVGVYDDGSLPDGLRFDPVVPTRIADTRIGQGWPAALGAAATATVVTPDTIAGPDTRALATNVTAVQPTASTYLTVWPAGEDGVSRPGTSNLNPAAGSIVPNAVQTMVGPGNGFHVYNNAGSTNFLVDVVGTFYRYPQSKPVGPSVQSAESARDLGTPKAEPMIRFHRA